VNTENDNQTAERPADSLQRCVRHLDLFSGIGGFALACQMVGGIKTIGFSEIEPYACSILKKHWPDVPNFGDIRTIKGIRADLVTGGFPCQPFSVAGKRLGKEDDRALWPEMLRVIDEAKPRWVLGENVPGIISMELDRVLSDLESLGYSVWPIVIPACGLDARHRRDRVWIMGYAEHAGRDAAEIRNGSQARSGNGATGTKQAGEPAVSSLEYAPLADATRKLLDGCGDAGQRRWDESANGGGWLAEPGMGRVAHGIPNRTHRLKSLGNAIVPQVAAEIVRTMMRVAQMSNDQELSHRQPVTPEPKKPL
jgi:DNA (cytosine-5)-methyltransferase 1